MSAASDGLEVRLKHRVHPGLSLDVSFRLGCESGILFGPSGAGKSTILRLIAGLTTPDIGFVRLGNSVLVDSPYWVDVPLRERRIGLIFQDDLLFPHLNVGGNVGFGLKGWPRREAEALRPEAERLVEVLFREKNSDAAEVAAAVRADRSLSEPQRTAAVRAVLRRSAMRREVGRRGG